MRTKQWLLRQDQILSKVLLPVVIRHVPISYKVSCFLSLELTRATASVHMQIYLGHPRYPWIRSPQTNSKSFAICFVSRPGYSGDLNVTRLFWEIYSSWWISPGEFLPAFPISFRGQWQQNTKAKLESQGHLESSQIPGLALMIEISHIP